MQSFSVVDVFNKLLDVAMGLFKVLVFTQINFFNINDRRSETGGIQKLRGKRCERRLASAA